MTMALERIAPLAYRSECVEDTVSLGGLVAPLLREGDVLVLTGGLGVGKTHFTKGVSAGLGDDHPVTSPTFALMAVHDGGRIPLFHFDLYRLEHAYELEDTGIYDVLGYEGVCLLEWGEQFQDELCDEFLSVRIERLTATLTFAPSVWTRSVHAHASWPMRSTLPFWRCPDSARSRPRPRRIRGVVWGPRTPEPIGDAA